MTFLSSVLLSSELCYFVVTETHGKQLTQILKNILDNLKVQQSVQSTCYFVAFRGGGGVVVTAINTGGILMSCQILMIVSRLGTISMSQHLPR